MHGKCFSICFANYAAKWELENESSQPMSEDIVKA